MYGVPDDGQSQPSPVHISSQPTRKPTKEDVQKEVTYDGAVFFTGHYHQPASPIHHYRSLGCGLMELLPYLASSLLSFPLHQITFLNIQLDRHCMKVSKVADSLMSYTEQFMEYDPFVSAIEPSNPWISDDTSFWDLEARWGRRGLVAMWPESLAGGNNALNQSWGQARHNGLAADGTFVALNWERSVYLYLISNEN